ncbi:hypothetical protein ACWGQ5_47170 [Streptomyces sp. NPDC055722]
MNTVASALAGWSPKRETYEDYRYPARYAWDFLADDAPWIIPEEIRYQVKQKVMNQPNAKGERRKKEHDRPVMARLMLKAWLNETGEDEWETLVDLAERYLQLHSIEAPPERFDKARG